MSAEIIISYLSCGEMIHTLSLQVFECSMAVKVLVLASKSRIIALLTPASTLVISSTLIPANGSVALSVVPGAVDMHLRLVRRD